MEDTAQKVEFQKENRRLRIQGMLRKKRKREEERPGVLTEFLLRGKPVPSAKIARYEARSRKKGLIIDNTTFSEIRKHK